MYIKSAIKKAFSVFCAIVIIILYTPSVYANIPHGTSDTWITEAQLNNTPPADYEINKDTQGKAKDKLYNEYFLDADLQEVHISIDDNNFNYLLQNAKEEPYVMAKSVTIGDTKIEYPGLRTKGDYTLVHSYDHNDGSDRFSFTINFGKYINKKNYGEKQTFYGCEKISFNNFYFDRSMLKEYLSYKLFEAMGVPVPQYGLAKLYVNNQYYGVYFMVEALEETIVEQYYDEKDVDGFLDKPRDTTLAYEQLLNFPHLICDNQVEKLEENKEIMPTVLEWSRKLTNLSNGMDFDGKTIEIDSEEYHNLLNQIMNVDETVKYFAIHSWLGQYDSMFSWYKNYGLYISEDGVSTVIPWDYDLSFGCFGGVTSYQFANYDLDKMYVDGIGTANRESVNETYKQFPMINVIYQSETLMEKYYQYMDECSKIAALGGYVESIDEFYEPAYFNDCIEKIENKLIEAVKEDTAGNVYYMNESRQPAYVMDAMSHIKNMVAMRAVGVKNIIDKSDYTVSTFGADLWMLGNGTPGDTANGGNLTIIDGVTGIYVNANYTNDNISPYLKVTELESKEALRIYKIESNKESTGNYRITIPVEKELLDRKDLLFSIYKDGVTKKLNMSLDDNLYQCTTDSLGYIVITKAPESMTINNMLLIIVGVVFVALEILSAILLYKARIRNCKKLTAVFLGAIFTLLIAFTVVVINVDKKPDNDNINVSGIIDSIKEPEEESIIIKGKSWWKDYENSPAYIVNGDEKYTFDINAVKNNPFNNAFCVEVFDELGNYFTLTSEGNAWYASVEGSILGANNAKTLKAGDKVRVIVTRLGNDYTFEFINRETNELMQKVIAHENGEYAGVVKIRIMAQIGEFEVEKVMKD